MNNSINNSMFNRQSLYSVCSKILAASLPLITLGLLGEYFVLYISMFVGTIALIVLIFNAICKRNIMVSGVVVSLIDDLTLPYAITLSSLILKNNGIKADLGLWIALILSVLTIVSTLVAKNKP